MTKKQNKNKEESIEDIVSEAWKMAEDYTNGSVVIQYLKNGKFLVTYQVDNNSFPDLGYGGFSASLDRIVERLDCRYYDIEYWEGEKQTAENRLEPYDYEDAYQELVHNVEDEVEQLKEKDKEE